jgi:cytoplasmic iron level regulating protein YaaA (DUF328/UPF0246 family)
MFIFVPPSEGKTVPTDAEPVISGSLVLPQLAPVRESLAAALAGLSSGPEPQAMAALGLTEGQRGELTRNQIVTSAPAAPAADVYRGVLYEALDLPGLRAHDPAAYRRAQESVLVFSALWGVLRPQDRIPYYRCSAGVKLPGAGSVTAVWKRALDGPLSELVGERLVVDLRSTAYAGMWRPAGLAARARTVTVRVVHERIVRGVAVRSVVSHWNKATKGRLVRAALVAGAEPKTPEDFAQALRDLGFRIEGGAGGALDVIVAEV